MVTGVSLIVVITVFHIGPKVTAIGGKADARFEQESIYDRPLTGLALVFRATNKAR